MEQRKIAFIGAGNMASAIVAGLVKSGYLAHLITVTAPSATHREALASQYGVNSSSDNAAAVAQADVVVLAVKPQLMQSVCEPLQGVTDWSNKLVLSIAAGIEAARYDDYLQAPLALVRIMPNTPSLVGEGVSGLFAKHNVVEKDKVFAAELMQSVGLVAWVDQEAKINDIIAVTGSSPAYFFLFCEAMQQKAEALGFDAQMARTLVLQAMQGAAALAKQESETDFTTLRCNVTSKGGTTAAALQVFQDQALSNTIDQAMQAAINRAEEMQKLF